MYGRLLTLYYIHIYIYYKQLKNFEYMIVTLGYFYLCKYQRFVKK